MSAVLVRLAGPAADLAPPSARWARATNDDRPNAVPFLRVGLVRTDGSWPWRDDPRLAPLIDAVRGVAFRSLRQHELVRPADAAGVPLPDLVITLDAAAARSAASLGRPAWLLARYDRNLRGAPRHDGVRVFRQPRPFDWRAPIARMAAELEAMARPLAPGTVEDLRPGPDWFPAATQSMTGSGRCSDEHLHPIR